MTDAPSITAKEIQAAERRLAALKARDSLLAFILMTMPDPEDPDNPEASRFEVLPHITLLAEALEKVARGECLRLAISMPPQHGKSETASRRFPAWFMGKFPYKNLMFGTYNQDFANNFGGQVREIIESKQFKQIFPGCKLRPGSRAKDEMFTTEGGQMSFLGRGGAGTGKPADLFIIDDPLKDAKEAGSPTIRAELHDWFSKVAFTRCHVGSAIIIIHTRWNEDDLIGRLCDPDHPEHDPEIAAKWTYINIPAIQTGDHVAAVLGKKKGDALWPERFPISHLMEAKKLNPRGFEALYQGMPGPDDGDYFRREMLVEYDRADLPWNLRKYGASDHAVTEKRENDAAVLGCVGIDTEGYIWILPDIVWERMETDRMVEEWLSQMKRHKPLAWWAEDELISKSVGPFLRKRQIEEGVFRYVEPVRPTKDKMAMGRSAQGLASLQRFRFPRFAPWWEAAKNELLKFPQATHDDFVTWLSMIALGVERLLPASTPRPVANDDTPKIGSIAWIKGRTMVEERTRRIRLAAGGF